MTTRIPRGLLGGPWLLAVCLLAGATLHCQDRGRDKFIKVFFPNGKSVTAELAVTEEERATGLMFREKLLPEQGMLFVFEREGMHSFWMKNTLIPLDMLWLDSDKRVIHVAADVPPCKEDPCPSYGPEIPARYVLELKAGEAAANGIETGDRLQFVLPAKVLQIMR
jgi:uncharacterized membrane protein (UPF0127 family)